MSTVKTYSIETDLPNGYNARKLGAEINTSGDVEGFDGFNVNGDVLDILGTSLTDESGLDATLAAHEAISLVDSKQLRYNEIDEKTKSLINDGFIYDSETFSLSTPAQTNWNSFHSNESEFSWPLEISTKDNNS